ncbi:ceramidase [Photobacterium sp. SDRW27]|uniref:hypothetical protein n=1 Tax=Photobacterium obscurum TaxID=2829490 RepID=UPI0022432E5C|nr:hypothetical protein [Photobacterium obscurum]MCW8328579.1 ceramidase [Photobacterium obscurum]
MTRIKDDYRIWLLLTITVIMAALALYFAPIKQSSNFYDYADQRTLLGIPHFWNVASNIPFLVVGLLGIWRLKARTTFIIDPTCYRLYLFFFGGLIATFLGSSNYHLEPNAFTLMLDRIPLSVTFVALYCIVLSEYISPTVGQRLFVPVTLYGALSVVYWYISDTITSRGDMSAYVLVQVVPIIHLPIIIGLFRARYSHGRYYLYALLAYIIAKWAESNDDTLYTALGGVSGHSIKHLLAGFGGYLIYLGFKKRSKITGPEC